MVADEVGVAYLCLFVGNDIPIVTMEEISVICSFVICKSLVSLLISKLKGLGCLLRFLIVVLEYFIDKVLCHKASFSWRLRSIFSNLASNEE